MLKLTLVLMVILFETCAFAESWDMTRPENILHIEGGYAVNLGSYFGYKLAGASPAGSAALSVITTLALGTLNEYALLHSRNAGRHVAMQGIGQIGAVATISLGNLLWPEEKQQDVSAFFIPPKPEPVPAAPINNVNNNNIVINGGRFITDEESVRYHDLEILEKLHALDEQHPVK